ncbi:MAG: hypothetical protein Q8Q14_01470 [Gemmatimonadales bacterium]|nr:hypothetical protein [Gemmatimonadales bacterium]
MSKGLIAENTLIKQTIVQIEQRLKAGVRESYQKIVVAGMKFAMGEKNNILAQLRESENVVEDAVKGAIGLVGVLRRAAKGAMPVDAMIPAGMTLALEALDFAERIGKIEIDASVIDEATTLFIETISPRLGLTPEKLGEMASRVQGVMGDNEKMSKIHGIGREPTQPGAA